MDNAILWINLYPVDNAVGCPNTSDLSFEEPIQLFNYRDPKSKFLASQRLQ